ncbi:GNAT family N-acetyltransferase [Gammaproteobacteria bacterium]|nr:GNAT family N-acetyltransferase [Gammaproteobacteria bacterium]
MPEYLGSEFQIAIQKRLCSNHSWIKDTPEMSNGGRVLNFLEPEKIGWPRIIELTHQYSCGSITAQPLEPMMSVLRKKFGADWDMPHWDAYFGAAKDILSACKTVIDVIDMPDGWLCESFEHPTDVQITEVQELNVATGIGPSPGWYMRGYELPTMTTCIRNEQGHMVATAMANCRYHARSRFADHLFQGSVSVSPDHRGKRLGNYVSASVFLDSHVAFGWKTALSQAMPTNVPSRRMIESCGLTKDAGLVTIAIIKQGQSITR